MAKKIVWSHESKEDLDLIAEYISRDSIYFAASFVQEILDVGYSLDMFSERGRVVPELGNQKIREVFVKNYRLFYSIEDTRIVILGIIHGKRDFKKVIDRIN